MGFVALFFSWLQSRLTQHVNRISALGKLPLAASCHLPLGHCHPDGWGFRAAREQQVVQFLAVGLCL